jgi:uncharacterized protein YqjF (DUF2071 family)
MPSFLKRHPLPMQAFFDYSLVLTYAFPEAVLRPLLPPALTLDGHGGFAFLAIAMVQTRAMRPVGCPRALGRDFFLSGYRVFTRYTRPDGKVLRGLRILRSDTDSRLMVAVGNRLTHYNYRHCVLKSVWEGDHLSLAVRTPGAEADLALRADLASVPATPPAGSPFPDWHTARRFAGPLPFTFDYEADSHWLVIIEGVRSHWQPRPIAVEVTTATFFDQPRFADTPPVLANAFLVEGVPYEWRRGVLEPLPGDVR